MLLLFLEGQGVSAVIICSVAAGYLVAICVHSMNVGISHCKSLSQVGENATVRLDRALIFLVPIDQDPVST